MSGGLIEGILGKLILGQVRKGLNTATAKLVTAGKLTAPEQVELVNDVMSEIGIGLDVWEKSQAAPQT